MWSVIDSRAVAIGSFRVVQDAMQITPQSAEELPRVASQHLDIKFQGLAVDRR